MLVPLREMPEEGQFVAVWSYQDVVWSDTFRWIDGELTQYKEEDDDFHDVEGSHPLYSADSIQFIVFEED